MAHARARTTDGTTVPLLILREDKEYDTDITTDHDGIRDEAAKISRFFRAATLHAAISNESLADIFCRMIWGSNLIEGLGADFDTTSYICRPIFMSRYRTSQRVMLRDIYLAAIRNAVLGHFDRYQLAPAARSVLHCTREVLNHGLAAMHLINDVVVEDKDLDAEIIMETHDILTEGIQRAEGLSWCEWSGRDREYYTTSNGRKNWCVDTEGLHLHMKLLARLLQHDVQSAVQAGRMDPVALAAKFCQLSYACHALHGGDGRLSRLILNALLLKYGGIMVVAGAEQDLDEYKEIAARARATMLRYVDGEDVESAEFHKELSSFLLRHVHSTMKRWRQTMEAGIEG
jgi:hypothetical protein